MILPPRLKKGDTIGIVAPSRRLDEGDLFELKRTIPVIEHFGFKTVLAPHLQSVDHFGYSAGTPQQRASDINRFFADPAISAIWCAQGGQTANMTLELLDYAVILKNPKLFIGMSDNTVLLNAIFAKTGLITFHGPDPKVYPEHEPFAFQYSQREFISRLVEGDIGEVNKKSSWHTVRSGSASGKLIGGNLRSFLKLAGTPYLPEAKNAILLIESYHIDIPEALYMLTRLRQMDIYNQIKAIIIGYIYGFQFPKKKSIQFEEIVLDSAKDYSFPILKINEFGHRCHNTFLPIGGEVALNLQDKEQQLLLTEPCVRS